MAGLTDAMTDGDLVKLNQKQRREVMASLQKSVRGQAKKEGDTNLKKADEFLEKNKIDNSDIKETPTGLQYQVLNEGSGSKPIASDKVRVHYYGELMDGTVFDSSYERGDPAEFGLNQVIKGWTEGLQLMKEGAKYKYFIHPRLGYGARPRPKFQPTVYLFLKLCY